MNDKMELEEAIRIYNELKKHKEIIGSIDTDFFFKFAETVLKQLEEQDKEIVKYQLYLTEDVIPKKKIKDKIKKLKSRGRIINQTFPDCGEYVYHEEIKALKELLEDK